MILSKFFIQNLLESIVYSATNRTFVTTGELESNFLTALTKKPKLNHWVNTTLNRLVVQFKPSRRCILKVISISPFFSHILNIVT